ncbi:hypothetical protein I3760_13G148100 [Carya illinoinensis]|nr:hypothetical protein I3760_13G148100 [Carya illinoinensis]
MPSKSVPLVYFDFLFFLMLKHTCMHKFTSGNFFKHSKKKKKYTRGHSWEAIWRAPKHFSIRNWSISVENQNDLVLKMIYYDLALSEGSLKEPAVAVRTKLVPCFSFDNDTLVQSVSSIYVVKYMRLGFLLAFYPRRICSFLWVDFDMLVWFGECF